ncbi:hypothetical protein EGL69_23180 [Vibrio parahaemolyticus]|nr:hypothetical protein EGL69_23180 [Vibrio parahaemolyticus]
MTSVLPRKENNRTYPQPVMLSALKADRFDRFVATLRAVPSNVGLGVQSVLGMTMLVEHVCW